VLTPAHGRGRHVELPVVDVELVHRIGVPVVGSPGVFGDEAAELNVIGLADELSGWGGHRLLLSQTAAGF
jgi:hypothetical protein